MGTSSGLRLGISLPQSFPNASRAVAVLGTLREAGAQHILLNPAYDHMQQMDVLVEKVIPQL